MPLNAYPTHPDIHTLAPSLVSPSTASQSPSSTSPPAPHTSSAPPPASSPHQSPSSRPRTCTCPATITPINTQTSQPGVEWSYRKIKRPSLLRLLAFADFEEGVELSQASISKEREWTGGFGGWGAWYLQELVLVGLGLEGLGLLGGFFEFGGFGDHFGGVLRRVKAGMSFGWEWFLKVGGCGC